MGVCLSFLWGNKPRLYLPSPEQSSVQASRPKCPLGVQKPHRLSSCLRSGELRELARRQRKGTTWVQSGSGAGPGRPALFLGMIQGSVVTALSPDLGIYDHHLRALVSYLKTVNHNLGAIGKQNQALAALGSVLP